MSRRSIVSTSVRDQLCVLWSCKDRAEGMLAVQGRLCLILTFNVQWCLCIPGAVTTSNSVFLQCIYVSCDSHNEQSLFPYIGVPNRLSLGAVEKLRKATISFVMSVCLSLHMEQLAPT
jgi:hypothetical protein